MYYGLLFVYLEIVAVVCGGLGGGWGYSSSGSLHFRDSLSRSFGKNGNLCVIACKVSGSLLCDINSYNSLWIVLGGLIIFWFVFVNCVYGCGFKICLSGGFCSSVIFSRSIFVQFGSGIHISRW